MNYFKKQFIGIDQLLMTVCNGNTDCTISGTTGYFAEKTQSKYWTNLEKIINFTFFPIDNIGHCKQAYESELGENYEKGWKFPLAMFTIASCVLIAPITWSYYLIKKISKNE